MRTPAHWLFQRITAHGPRPFLAAGGTVFSYGDLETAIGRMDSTLGGHVPAGASVALLGDYALDPIAALLWLFDNRNVVVPVAPGAPTEFEERAREAFCEFVLDCNGPPALRPLPAPGAPHELLERLRSAGRSGLVLFSSGSAGKPKAMIHDLDNLVEVYAGRKSRNLSMIVFLMFDHIGGVNTLLNALASGSFLIAPQRRDAEEVAALIEQYRVAVLPTSPTFLNLMLLAEVNKQHDLSSLRIITYGTEPMPESLLLKLRSAFPRVKFLQTFGTSETGISRTDSKSSGSLFMKLDDPDIEHRIVDGELWLRSKTQILGYLNHSMEAFTPDGWFRTGDRVEADKDGYIRVIGRSREIINVGGEKVTPSEVESVILEVPGVADCTAFGMPSPITGQIVAVKVALADGVDRSVIRASIREHCAGRLARYKVPVKISLVEGGLFGERFKKLRA